MSPKFKRVAKAERQAVSPERLFDELSPTRTGAPSLWAHQADLLRSYHSDHVKSPDVAIELPTGAGKTLPALLIAEWRRRFFRERVAYACPTTQLADQVAEAASRQGIRAVTLHGRAADWNTLEASGYEAGRAIAITTYSTIFNLSPKLTGLRHSCSTMRTLESSMWHQRGASRSIAISNPSYTAACSTRSATSCPACTCKHCRRTIPITAREVMSDCSQSTLSAGERRTSRPYSNQQPATPDIDCQC